MQKDLYLGLVDFNELVLLDKVIHFNETLGSDLNLIKHIGFHPHIVVLVLSKEGTVRADSCLIIDTDDLQLPMMDGTQGLHHWDWCLLGCRGVVIIQR